MIRVGSHEDEIRRNIRQSRLLIAANVAVLGGTGAVLGSSAGPAAAAVLAMLFIGGGLLTSLAVSAGIGLVGGARRAGTRAPHAQSMLTGVALAAGIPTPQLYLVDDPEPNAFAWGRRPERSNVAVTTGLLQRLTPREVEAVLAHEVAHIANRDTRLLTVAFGCYGLLFVIAAACAGVLALAGATTERSDEDNSVVGVIALAALCLGVAIIPALVVSWLVALGVSREREALADVTAVKYLGAPGQLRRALEAFQRYTPQYRPGPIAAMCIHSPAKHGTLRATHPPLEWRIAVLRQLEGLSRAPAVTAPAGWYPDPWQVATHRWFDGSTWTGHTAR